MSLSYHDIEQFIIREARFLDDREWDKWLECYHEDVTYWMPAWDDRDRLTELPKIAGAASLELGLETLGPDAELARGGGVDEDAAVAT